jgi:hypothetical protein
MSLLSRSSCQLQKLKLENVCITSADLLYCLKATPLLLELEVGGKCGVHGEHWLQSCHMSAHVGGGPFLVNDPVLEELTYRSGLPPLIPLLHSVHLHGGHNFSDNTLLDMAESRWCGQLPEGQGRLSSVRVGLYRNFSQQAEPRVQVLREEGLSIILEKLVFDW